MELEEFLKQMEIGKKERASDNTTTSTPGLSKDTLDTFGILSDEDYKEIVTYAGVSEGVEERISEKIRLMREEKLRQMREKEDKASHQLRVRKEIRQKKAKKNIDAKRTNVKWTAKPWMFK